MTATLEQLDGEPIPPYLSDYLSATQHRKAKIEDVDPVKGTILMRGVPYDHEIQLYPEFFETFAPGTFAAAQRAPHRAKLWHEHGGPIVGCGVEVDDRADGLWIRARFANTQAGQDARELARDGIIDQVSIEFRPLEEWLSVKRSEKGMHVTHKRAHLLGVALVAHGAYDSEAFVAAVRDDADKERERSEALARERAERLARLDALAH